MTSLGLFDLAFRQNEWLAKRQSVIASNIVNVNTPGYQAKEVSAFENVMRNSTPMAGTNSAHFTGAGAGSTETVVRNADGAESVHSGNNVSLESEFMKSGEVMRSYSINSRIITAFHRMVLAAAKG